MSTTSPRRPEPEESPEAAAYGLVGGLLVAFGLFSFVLAVIAGPILDLDLGFLGPQDMIVISGVMLVTGALLRRTASEWRDGS